MRLQDLTMLQIKVTLAAAWLLSAVTGGVLLTVSSPGGFTALAAVGLLPPLAMHLLWQDPAQTMSERIDESRR